MTLKVERAKELLNYDPPSGQFTWRARQGFTRLNGKVAGTISHWGYRIIEIDSIKYRAARLAVLLMRGLWPDHEVYNIYRNKANDRWVNLRLATPSQNKFNRQHPGGASAYRGVYRQDNGWMAIIKVNQQSRYLGTFDTQEEAALAYDEAAIEIAGIFAQPNFVSAA